MELTTFTNAIVTGITTGVATGAAQETFIALKELAKQKYAELYRVLEILNEIPNSAKWQQALTTQAEQTQAYQDSQLVELVKQLQKQVEAQAASGQVNIDTIQGDQKGNIAGRDVNIIQTIHGSDKAGQTVHGDINF